MDTTQKYYFDKQSRSEEKDRLLLELRQFLKENNPPLLSDLIIKIKPIVKFNHVKSEELLLMINQTINPCKIILDQEDKAAYTHPWYEDLKMIDSRETTPATDDMVTIRLNKKGTELLLETPEKSFKLYTFRPGSYPSKIFDYLMTNEGEILRYPDVKMNADSLDYKYSPSELARSVGFDKKLKDYFLPIRSKSEIRFRKSVKISKDDLSKLEKTLMETKPY
jgi:hypothetical protein